MSLFGVLGGKTEKGPIAPARSSFDWQNTVRENDPGDKSIVAKLKGLVEVPWPRESSQEVGKDFLFRASELHKDCPRRRAIQVFNHIPEVGVVEFDLGWIFGIGTAIGRFLANDIFAAVADPETSRWKCAHCGSIYAGQVGECGECGAGKRSMEYVERYYEKDGICGHTDQLWRIDDEVGVAEFKTINAPSWYTLEAPKEDHISQINAYFHLTGLSKGWVVYFGKDVRDFSGTLKVFEVKRNESVIEGHLLKARAFQEAMATGVLPVRKSRCRGGGCPVRVICAESKQ